MGTNGEQEGSSATAPPWAAAFDPAANIRALGVIQRRGLADAQRLLERFVGPTVTKAEPAGDDPEDGSPEEASALGDLLGSWTDLIARSAEVVTGLVQRVATATPDGGPRGPTVEVGRPPHMDTLRIVVDRCDGETAAHGTAQLWLHNVTDAELLGLRAHCGELRATSGAVLDAAVSFEPAVVGRLAPRSRRAVLVRVLGVDGAAAPEEYRGIVSVAGAPDTWLAVEVIVAP